MALLPFAANMQKTADDLEALLDGLPGGLAELLNALAFVCSEKAEHVLASYGDATTAAVWEQATAELLKTDHRLHGG